MNITKLSRIRNAFKIERGVKQNLIFFLRGSGLCLLPQGSLPHTLQNVVGDQGSDGTQQAGEETECGKNVKNVTMWWVIRGAIVPSRLGRTMRLLQVIQIDYDCD